MSTHIVHKCNLYGWIQSRLCQPNFIDFSPTSINPGPGVVFRVSVDSTVIMLRHCNKNTGTPFRSSQPTTHRTTGNDKSGVWRLDNYSNVIFLKFALRKTSK